MILAKKEIMKLTKTQQQPLDSVMPRALEHVKNHSKRNCKRPIDDLRDMTKEVPSLRELQVVSYQDLRSEKEKRDSYETTSTNNGKSRTKNC